MLEDEVRARGKRAEKVPEEDDVAGTMCDIIVFFFFFRAPRARAGRVYEKLDSHTRREGGEGKRARRRTAAHPGLLPPPHLLPFRIHGRCLERTVEFFTFSVQRNFEVFHKKKPLVDTENESPAAYSCSTRSEKT